MIKGMSDGQTRIGLFGGTFDPVHKGHIRIAQEAREALQLDRVVMIPCALSPHKTDGPKPVPGQSRMEMIRIACEPYPWMSVDACELDREGESYSWQTAEHFRARFPTARLFWILGEDQWQALPRWSNPEQLASLVEFIVFARNHRTPAPRDGVKAWFLPESHTASATEIRNELHGAVAGDRAHPWIDPAVMEYIRAHGLYEAG